MIDTSYYRHEEGKCPRCGSFYISAGWKKDKSAGNGERRNGKGKTKNKNKEKWGESKRKRGEKEGEEEITCPRCLTRFNEFFIIEAGEDIEIRNN